MPAGHAQPASPLFRLRITSMHRAMAARKIDPNRPSSNSKETHRDRHHHAAQPPLPPPRSRRRRARAWAQAPIVIKAQPRRTPADTPKGKGSEFFEKRAAELTKGKVKVERSIRTASSTRTRGGDGGAAARLRCRCSRRRSRSSRRSASGIRDLRLPLSSTTTPTSQGDERARSARPDGQARRQGHQRPRLLGQRLQVVLVEPQDGQARGHRRA